MRISQQEIATAFNSAFADGILTRQQFIDFPYNITLESMLFLFSPDGRQAVRDGIITTQQFIDLRFDSTRESIKMKRVAFFNKHPLNKHVNLNNSLILIKYCINNQKS